MLSGGEVAAIIAAAAWAVLVLALVFVLVRVGRTLASTQQTLETLSDRTVLLLDKVSTTVDRAKETTESTNQAIGSLNERLDQVGTIGGHVEQVAQNVSALTSLFSATLGGPLVRVAAFSYGVRRAASKRTHRELEDRARAEAREQRRAARATRKAG